MRFHRKRERNGFMRKRKMYLSVEDIAELFGLSVSFAYRSIIKTGKVTKRENKNVDSGPKARQKSGSETFFSNRARV